jgi:hypothetical protein
MAKVTLTENAVNVKASVGKKGTKKNVLTIEVDLDEEHGLTSSERANKIASSAGWCRIDLGDGFSFSLNVVGKKAKK